MSVDPHCRWQEGTHDDEVDGIVALVGERIAANRKEGGGVIRFRTCEKWKTPPRLSGVFLFPSIARDYTFFIPVRMVLPSCNIIVDLCQ